MYTNFIGNDGFGSQYQKIIQTYIYCMHHKLDYYYCPIQKMEHNYENDANYIVKIEEMINLKNNIQNGNDKKCIQINFGENVLKWFEHNIDLCHKGTYMEFIKKCFWENKSKNVFNNNYINIAVHIRRNNSHDKGQAGERITTPNESYLNVMNTIRNKYSEKKLKFHIYSQGNRENFNILENDDVEFHLNEDICKTFIQLVGAEILVISPSSLSYVAGLISDGEIYYKSFWHKPCKNWVKYE